MAFYFPHFGFFLPSFFFLLFFDTLNTLFALEKVEGQISTSLQNGKQQERTRWNDSRGNASLLTRNE